METITLATPLHLFITDKFKEHQTLVLAVIAIIGWPHHEIVRDRIYIIEEHEFMYDIDYKAFGQYYSEEITTLVKELTIDKRYWIEDDLEDDEFFLTNYNPLAFACIEHIIYEMIRFIDRYFQEYSKNPRGKPTRHLSKNLFLWMKTIRFQTFL